MTAPAVELRHLTVRFGAVTAVRGLSLAVERGEVHAVVGENGAGKSTLMRTVYGLVAPSEGEVLLGGVPMARSAPEEALARGVGMVHQHFQLVETLTVAENVALGREPGRGGLFDRARAEREVAELAERHGLAVEPWRRIDELSVGERQRVEILKALSRGARTLILDEPTAVLTPAEVTQLLALVRRMRAAGDTVILVTHKLDEVVSVADRVTVMRRGERVETLGRGGATPQAIARLMVGREIGGPPPPARAAPGEVLLSLASLTVESARGGRAVDGLSLEVRAGEIVGVAGVEGNGQTELVEAIVGLAHAAGGRVALDGGDVTRASVAARRRLGLAHVPEDRHRRGLLLGRSIAENLLLGREERYARFGMGFGRIDRQKLREETLALLERFDVRPAEPDALAGGLSGGNQQKVVLARELARSPRVLVAAQPTRGVDVGAIERIHLELARVRDGGGGVLLVSAELDELLALADRIVVMLRGRLVGELPRAAASREALAPLMTGARG